MRAGTGAGRPATRAARHARVVALLRSGPVRSQTELAELRSRIEHANDLADDDRRAISRQLDRIERTMDRICDRMDTDARIGTALARMNRPEGD